MDSTTSIFDSQWSENIIPDVFKTHRNIIIAGSLIGIIFGLILLVVSGFGLYKHVQGSEWNINILIGLVIVVTIALILSAIAMGFSGDLNSKSWVKNIFKRP